MKKVVGGMVLFYCIISFGIQPEKKKKSDTPITITKELIAKFKQKDFKEFIEERKNQFQTGNTISNIPIIGVVFDWGLGALKGVDMEKAKKFFERIDTEASTLNAKLHNFEQDDTSLAYLQDIFAQMTPHMIASKSTSDLSQAIEKVKEKHFPNSKTMYTKSSDNTYTYAPDKFANYALCSLMAGHIVNQSSTKGLPRQRKRRNFNGS